MFDEAALKGSAPFDPYEGFEEGPLTTVIYYGTWGLTLIAAALVTVGAFMLHPGAGIVAVAYLAKKSAELLIPVYQWRTRTEQQLYGLRRVEQFRAQQEIARHEEAAQRLTSSIENDPRRI